MAGILRVPRTRGALSGLLLVLLGAWGALIPFIGPYFHYAYTPDHAWTYNSDRLWLEVLPGAATLLGGLIVLAAATRPVALFGGWLAAMSGAWFVLGRPLSTLWTTGGVPAGGDPVGGTVTRVVEEVGFFTGLGVVILFFAALALGRFTVVGAREVARAAEESAAAERAETDRVAAEQAAADSAATDRAATDRAATDRAAMDRAAMDRAAMDRAAMDSAATERLATDPAATTEVPASRPSVPGSHAAP